jgi:hypothetical protein
MSEPQWTPGRIIGIYAFLLDARGPLYLVRGIKSAAQITLKGQAVPLRITTLRSGSLLRIFHWERRQDGE